MVLFLNNQFHSDRDFKVLDRLSISQAVIFLRLNGTRDRMFLKSGSEKNLIYHQSWPDSFSFFFPKSQMEVQLS